MERNQEVKEWEWTERHYGICVLMLLMHELVAFQSDEQLPDVELSLLTGAQRPRRRSRRRGCRREEKERFPPRRCSPAVFLLVRR